jgi:hypothetical protein
MEEENRNTEKSKCVHQAVYEWNKMTKHVRRYAKIHAGAYIS